MDKNADEKEHSGGQQHGLAGFLEETLERVIFGSRWILAVFYLVLVLAQVALAGKFLQHSAHLAHTFWSMSETEFVMGMLSLIDMTLMANLMILVIFSGYENFVSVIGVAQRSPDRPKWMGDVDFGGLKLKLIGSLVALSSLNLLGAFYNLETKEDKEITWMLIIHVTFVITGVLFAFSEKIAGHGANSAKQQDH